MWVWNWFTSVTSPEVNPDSSKWQLMLPLRALSERYSSILMFPCPVLVLKYQLANHMAEQDPSVLSLIFRNPIFSPLPPTPHTTPNAHKFCHISKPLFIYLFFKRAKVGLLSWQPPRQPMTVSPRDAKVHRFRDKNRKDSISVPLSFLLSLHTLTLP